MSDLSSSPTPVEPTDDDGNTRPRYMAVGLISVMLVIVVAMCALSFMGEEEVVVAPPPPPAPVVEIAYADYVVQPGDFLIKIADDHGITLEQLIEDNEVLLVENSKDCFKLDQDYIDGVRKVKKHGKTIEVPRPGYYCNTAMKLDGKPMMAPNSIKAGMHLQVRLPVGTAIIAGNPTL